MSNATAGFNGVVQISTDDVTYNTIGEVRNVRLQVSGENIDATSFDSAGWRERIVGLSDWRWSASAFYLEANTAQDNIRSAITGRTGVYLRLIPKGSAMGNQRLGGFSQIVAFNVEGAVDDAFAIDMEGVALAALTVDTVP